MSRVAKKPILIPKGVDISVNSQTIKIKGPNGQLDCCLDASLKVEIDDNLLKVLENDQPSGNPSKSQSKTSIDVNTIAGTMRAILNNMIVGVSEGYEKKLRLVGVGFRAQMQGNTLNLSLGFSHPVTFAIPEGITIEMPSQTEITVKGVDKQLVGQVAANIRVIRPVEPYKGKGVRYHDERVQLKETKKK